MRRVARAQEQEKKLLDRLLKPDMTMQNDAEKKQFVAGGETITKKAPTKSFFFAKRKPEKGFWDTRQVDDQRIFCHEFTAIDASKMANLSTRTRIAKADVALLHRMYGDIRTARDGTRTVTTSELSGVAPFSSQRQKPKIAQRARSAADDRASARAAEQK